MPRPLRRLLHLYFWLSRGMTLGVRAVVLRDQREVFLVRHTYTAGWHLPGGGVERGETLLQALEKELREEACIGLAGPPLLHGVFFNRAISPRDHVAVFIVRDFTVQEAKQPDREIAEARFFRLDDLPEGMTAGTRRRLDEVLAGRPATQDW
ncbi:NUDIX domain-containing protein [Bosea sp. BK604]|uniref:NUDIX domain-containing protein n=1 Tax=Bosea sp. BK604 TaxID=2512180 RepID=UPI00104423B2|nr:NUDIX domain-containing protein [Bosea sp. BK604]TCR69917.1 ADP-ribose pyrophosphatase YjhB (NUDIX family) [Bosea sp. BK604]